MAFSFGSSTPAFGASVPAFGASSAPSFGGFGASSAATFGQSSAAATFSFSGFGASSSSSFGASSTPAFGASTPAFGASAPALGATTSVFGASSTPSLFGSSASTLGASSTPSLFGGTTAFGAPRPAGATGSMFNFAQSSGSLFSFNSAPAQGTFGATLFGGASQPATALQPESHLTYSTKWEEIPPAMQQKLLELQNVVSSHRGDCEILDKDPRLHDATALKKSLEEEASALKQAFVNLCLAVKVDDAAMVDFRQKVMKLIYSTESVVRIFHRCKAWREYPQKYKGQQQVLPASLYEQLTAPVVLPSPFLEMSIDGFKEVVSDFQRCVAELEQALPSSRLSSLRSDADADITHTLPLILSNLHDYFLSVAAQLERLHSQLQQVKSTFLEQQRQEGNFVDPFAEARRQQRHKDSNGFSSGQDEGTPVHFSTAIMSAAAQPHAGFGEQPGAPGTSAPPAATPASANPLFGGGATPSLFPSPSAPIGGTAAASGVTRQKSGRSKKK